MFEITGTAAEPVYVRASFWQCLKAGAAFTIGALLTVFVASILWAGVMVRVLPVVLQRMVER